MTEVAGRYSPDTEGEAALRAVIAQMQLSETRFENSGESPEFLRGYREGRYKVTHILGETRASRIFRERREAWEK